MLASSVAESLALKESGVAQVLRVQRAPVERRQDVEAKTDSGSAAAAGPVHDQRCVKLCYCANVQKWRRGYTLMRSYENESGMKVSGGLGLQRGRTGLRVVAISRHLQRAQKSGGAALVPVGE